MNLTYSILVILIASILHEAYTENQQGVFSKKEVLEKVRQGTLRQYLPPVNTQKPRPFEPVTPTPQPTVPGGGYPPAGSSPRPPFPPSGGYPGPDHQITPPEQQPDYTGGYPTPSKPRPPFEPGRPTYPVGPTGPSTLPTRPGYPTPGYPGYPTPGYPGYPSTQRPGFPTAPPIGYPTNLPGFPSQPPTGYPSQQPTGYPTQPPTQPPSYPTQPSTGYPTRPPTSYPTQPTTGGYPSQPTTGYPTQPTGYPTQPTGYPSTPGPVTSSPTETFTSPPGTEENTIPPGPTGSSSTAEEDLKHPPHIHAIDVECAKDMMTINIEFNRQFDGVIYSKGYYNNPECRYVKENSGQTKYTFTVSLNSCGTEFINAFDTQGQSYLENVLVLQNEPGIQEVWDTIRSVRCLWEGNLKESLSVALSVGMLSQEIVTFSGDTAMAKLDILTGKGPFGQPANGLVKIGEPMTLVVSVSGDPGFDIQVKDCKAKDSSGDNEVSLTDDNGCVLKPKLFGAFQKTRNTGSTGASIIAYAYFNAFKFPDVMDLMIECNIELCKTDCQVCPDPNQKIDPARRKRRDTSDLYYHNETIGDAVTMGKHLRVILPEDLSNGKTVINLSQPEGVCMTTQNFVFSSAMLISLLATSCLFSAYMWLKNQRLTLKL